MPIWVDQRASIQLIDETLQLRALAAALLSEQMSSPQETVLNGVHHRVDTYRYGSFSFAGEEEDPFFVTHSKPEGLDIVKATADSFIKYQKALNRPVVLVTSGGSTVPLEVCCPWARMLM